MSISTEIGRIEAAKSDIAAAISGKGVSVPANTKIDGMASLIGQIQTGSGGGGGVPTTITAGDTPVALSNPYIYAATSTSYSTSGLSIVINKAGTYKFRWITYGADGSSSRVYSKIMQNNIDKQEFNTTTDTINECTINCAANDVILVVVKGYKSWSTTYGGVGMLTACIDWDNGF